MDRPTIDLESDGLFKLAIGSLWFCGATYLLLGLFFAVAFVGTAAVGRGIGVGELVIMLFIGLFSFVMIAAIAGGNFAVAWGLKNRRKWAWIGAVIIGGLYAPSGCLPFGALLLYAMLRSGVRETFEAEAHAASDAPTSF